MAKGMLRFCFPPSSVGDWFFGLLKSRVFALQTLDVKYRLVSI
jgi:hypothetical protein